MPCCWYVCKFSFASDVKHYEVIFKTLSLYLKRRPLHPILSPLLSIILHEVIGSTHLIMHDLLKL